VKCNNNEENTSLSFTGLKSVKYFQSFFPKSVVDKFSPHSAFPSPYMDT